MAKVYSFEKLTVWQLAIELIKRIYRIAQTLPKTETFGLSDQMKRASVSVALNIAEGRAADSDADFRRFLGISLKSLVEVIACIKIGQSLNFIKHAEVEDTCSFCNKLEANIRSFRRILREA